MQKKYFVYYHDMKVQKVILLFIFCFGICGLNEPEDGSQLNSVHVLFDWDQEPDAIAYNLQVFLNPSDIPIIDIVESSTLYLLTTTIDWENSYHWRIRPIYNNDIFGDWIESSSFSTGVKALTTLDINIYNDELIDDDLIMYSQFGPNLVTGVIDKYGNEIWHTENMYMNHVSKNGEVYGMAGPGVKFNFDEEILWSTPSGTEIDSHEIKQIPNGNFMAFVPTYEVGPIPQGPWTSYFQILGYQADGVTNEFPWMGLRIVEFDKITGEELWSWDPFEHFSMNDCDLYEGYWWAAAFGNFFDWMHSNAFHFDQDESVIYVSHRHLSRISKIAYPSGDVIWNMGLPDEYNTGEDNICEDLMFSFQHHIQMLDDGTLLFFDNGNLSYMFGDEYPTTRIRRIRVIDNSYCETVWQYDLPPNLHGLGMGSVQLLENGNYSIYTYGNGLDDSECSIIEINSEGELVWKATSQDDNAAWYRAYKIPSIYPDAFSVEASSYTLNNQGEDVIVFSNSIDFSIQNKSGFEQEYRYEFLDLMDGGSPFFSNSEGNFILDPNEVYQLSFPVINSDFESTLINLSVWPIHHNYAIKEFFFNAEYASLNQGDINGDGFINVLDIVNIVSTILNEPDFYSENYDLNNDDSINVIDIVFLVNIILS